MKNKNIKLVKCKVCGSAFYIKKMPKKCPYCQEEKGFIFTYAKDIPVKDTPKRKREKEKEEIKIIYGKDFIAICKELKNGKVEEYCYWDKEEWIRDAKLVFNIAYAVELAKTGRIKEYIGEPPKRVKKYY